MTSEPPVLCTVDAGVMKLTWNRPDKKNAITGAMYDAFTAALGRAATDPDVRVVLVSGAGAAFTSGNDLADFATWVDITDPEELPVVRAIRQVVAFPKPLIAAVRGPAVGIGTTLLLSCDAVVASTTASFAMPFVRLGLVPEFGSSYLLPAIAGRLRARHLLLLGEKFGAADALAAGIVTEVCEDAALDERATLLSRQFAALPPTTVRTIKALLDGPAERARLNQAIDDELVLVMKCLRSPEHLEAVAAFREKRPPVFMI